jgi:hypothetical protein
MSSLFLFSTLRTSSITYLKECFKEIMQTITSPILGNHVVLICNPTVTLEHGVSYPDIRLSIKAYITGQINTEFPVQSL